MVRMLHFNAAPAAKAAGDEDVYKVLILDRHTKVCSCMDGAGGEEDVGGAQRARAEAWAASPPRRRRNRLRLLSQPTRPPLRACNASPATCLPPLQDILAPLLHVNALRRHGVTLHMLLDAERQPIPDVPAVYFVQVGPAAGLLDSDCCRCCLLAALLACCRYDSHSAASLHR